jgi:hypothetical protein
MIDLCKVEIEEGNKFSTVNIAGTEELNKKLLKFSANYYIGLVAPGLPL